MRIPVVLADEAAFLAQAQLHETCIPNHNGLEP